MGIFVWPLVLLGTLLYGTLIGWLVHWAIHQKWAGGFYYAHMNHHWKQYPPKDLTSDEYRRAGLDDGLLVFAPIILVGMLLLEGALYVCNCGIELMLVAAFMSLFVGAMHDWIHEQFHLISPRIPQTWKIFQYLQSRHFEHHRNLHANLGMVWFGWDRLFGTYKSGNKIPKRQPPR